MALILGFEQQLSVNHESAVIVNNCDAAAWVQLIWRIHLPRALHLQEIRDVDGIATQRVHIIALILYLCVVSRLEMISNFQMSI